MARLAPEGCNLGTWAAPLLPAIPSLSSAPHPVLAAPLDKLLSWYFPLTLGRALPQCRWFSRVSETFHLTGLDECRRNLGILLILNATHFHTGGSGVGRDIKIRRKEQVCLVEEPHGQVMPWLCLLQMV